MDDVGHRRVFILDVDKYLAVTRDPEMPGPYWKLDELPVSTTLQVSRLSDPCFLIEIDLVAMVE